MYSELQCEQEYVSDMLRSVQRCLAAALPNNKLIVVGRGVNSEDDQGSNNMSKH